MAGRKIKRNWDPQHYRPARGYTWDPIEPTHGADSPTALLPIADRLAADLAVVAPWTQARAFSGVVRSYCWAEAQVLLLRAYVDRLGWIDDDGEIPAGVGGLIYRLDTTEARLIKLRQELGLTPQSLASLLSKASSLARAVNDDDMLAALEAEGLAITRARAALSAAESVDDPAGVQTDTDSVNVAQRVTQHLPEHETEH